MAFIGDLVKGLTSSIADFAKAMAKGIGDFASGLFLIPDTNSLSAFGWLIVGFASIGLAVGLTRFVTKWIMSMGAKK